MRFASASVIARGRGRVVQILCVRRGLFGMFRGPHMLKAVATFSNLGEPTGFGSAAFLAVYYIVIVCSNLLVLFLLGVWVMGGINGYV